MDNKLIKPTTDILKNISFLLKSYVDKSNGSGLYQGLMGICISYFILSKVTGEQRYRKTAFKYLNKVQQSIPAIDDLGFANGLAGIGWGVEWLVQNGFIKANTENVLEDFDDTLYTSVLYSKDFTLSLADGSIGKALYYLYRMQANNPHKRRYRVVCNLECLVLLSDEISEKISDKIGSRDQVKIMDSELTEIAQSLILLLKINDQKINTATTRTTIKVLIIFIETFLVNNIKNRIKLNKDRGYLYMVYAYLLTLKILEKEGFSENSALITQYLESMNYTSQSILNHFLSEDTRLQSISEDKYAVETGQNLFDLLKNINSIDNTSYGYEAFLIK